MCPQPGLEVMLPRQRAPGSNPSGLSRTSKAGGEQSSRPTIPIRFSWAHEEARRSWEPEEGSWQETGEERGEEDEEAVRRREEEGEEEKGEQEREGG